MSSYISAYRCLFSHAVRLALTWTMLQPHTIAIHPCTFLNRHFCIFLWLCVPTCLLPAILFPLFPHTLAFRLDLQGAEHRSLRLPLGGIPSCELLHALPRTPVTENVLSLHFFACRVIAFCIFCIRTATSICVCGGEGEVVCEHTDMTWQQCVLLKNRRFFPDNEPYVSRTLL